jgi:hypothetical protein
MAIVSGLLEFLSSPRRQRRLFLLSAAVFVAGLAAFLALVVFHNTSNAFPDRFSNQPAQLIRPDKKAPVTKDQIALARRFLKTAVTRTNLDSAYWIVGPDLRGALSRKEWDTGNIPVLWYHASNVDTVAFSVDYSYKTQALFEVNLHAVRGTEERPTMLFFIGLRREGGKPNGRWQVNYFEPNWRPPIPMAPD